MKFERLLVQQNPRDSLYPVRLLRVTEDTRNEENSYLHVGKRGICCEAELRDAVFAFKREFPKRSKVEVEVDAETVRELNLIKDAEWLFDHPSTFRSSL